MRWTADGLDDVAQRLAGVVCRFLPIAALGLVTLKKDAEILDSHAAIGVQQFTEVRRLVAQGFLIQKTVDSGVIPNFVNNFYFIWAHRRFPLSFGRVAEAYAVSQALCPFGPETASAYT